MKNVYLFLAFVCMTFSTPIEARQISVMNTDERMAFHLSIDEAIEAAELRLADAAEELRSSSFDVSFALRFEALSNCLQVKRVLSDKFRNSSRMDDPHNRDLLLSLLQKELIDIADMQNFEKELR